MARLLTIVLCACVFLPIISVGDDVTPSRYRVATGVDISFIDVSGYQSWTEGSVGKLRFDDGNDGLGITRGFIDYHAAVTDTLDANIAVEF